MARNYSNSPQQPSNGFWDTSDRSDVQEYKKPSTCEDYISGKKKTKINKKPKPAPALASLMFTTSKDEASGNMAQYEPPSGPNAWSMKSGSALFRGELPENRRRLDSPSSYRMGRHDPYYPEPQTDLEELGDEDELLRKAIEESMRTAQEEQARKKRQEKEEEEWLSKVCAELKNEDKKSVWMQKFAEDAADDEFIPLTVDELKLKPKPLTPPGKSTVKKPETKRKQPDWSLKPNVEKKQTDWSSKPNVERKPDWSSKEPLPKKEAKQPERTPLRDAYQEERKENRESNALRTFTNMYDDYDDDGSESEEPDRTPRQTYWHPQNESHKWNQETWGGQSKIPSHRSGKQESWHDRKQESWNDRKQESWNARKQESWNDRKQESWHDRRSSERPTEEKQPDNEREAPKEQRARTWKQDNAPTKDFHQNEHSASPQKSRNFKVGFYKNKLEAEAQFEKDSKSVNDFKKHVQFQRAEETSSSESELNAFASNFASSKSSFDEHLYSNQAQRSKTPAQALEVKKVNAVSKTNVSTASRNNRKDSAYSSDERDSRHNTSHSKHPGTKPSPFADQTGSKPSVVPNNIKPNASPIHSNKPNVGPNSWKHKMSAPEPSPGLANENLNQLEENMKDITLDSISSGPFSPPFDQTNRNSNANETVNTSTTKARYIGTQSDTSPTKPTLEANTDMTQALTPTGGSSNVPSNAPTEPSVRDELRAEVHLPQDNQIYNFYLNKQLGKTNAEDQTDPYGLPHNAQVDPYQLPHGQTRPDPYNLPNTQGGPDPYNLPNAQGGPDPYLPPPDGQQAQNSPLAAFMSNYVAMETQRQSHSSYPPVSTLSSAPIMSSVPFSPYAGYPPAPRHDGFGFNHYLSSQPVPYPHYPPRASTPLPPEPHSSWSNMPNPPASWVTATPSPAPTGWSTVPPPVPHTPWTNSPQPVSSPWLPPSAPPVLEDNALWRHVLAQAENNPRMLEEMITCLNKNTSECSDPAQLDTLIAMSLEVDAAVRKLAEKSQQQLQAPQGEELVPPDLEEDKSTGRGRGKMEPPRDHVLSSAGVGRGRGYMPSS